MPVFQLQSCSITLDPSTTIFRDAVEPVTFPERLVLESIYGKANVNDVRIVGEEDRDEADERDRLSSYFGEQAFRKVFPSDHQPLPTEDVGLAARVAKDAAEAAKKAAALAKEAEAFAAKAKASKAS